ncbi:Pogo transposable element with KRAB domain [Frankliniella fusca]|uniref:Pogo transposable element with KRAB domain n=1 Tax=Frankliniella fusca TaxID=407009 RepID=A0AAE1LA37_9NEOP|nr:Pogo transposable element with KRAB domain [Frankliniella fusca]
MTLQNRNGAQLQTQNRGKFGEGNMKAAIEAVKGGLSFRIAAERFNVKHQTLYKKYKEYKDSPDINLKDLKKGFVSRRIFTDEQETISAEYVLTVAQMGLGLSVEQTCELAYEFAVINKIEVPKNWKNDECGGRDWFRCFLRRHPNLSIRKPEACSIARASSFNKANMDNGSRVFNLDECGTTTVACLGKIVAPKGQKQVYQSTSQERGTLVTTCLIVGALGQVIPPVMLFPRKNFKNNMTIGAYPGTLGLACESGWMNAELFPKVLQHIVKHTACTKENPLVVLCDNLEAHITLEAIEYARENGITILTLVPHTTHRSQPLDVSIMGPFKRAYENAMCIWKRAHPHQCCTIMAQFVCTAVGKALTPANITAGFKKTGIMPFDRTVFKELDFMPSNITDRPNPEASEDMNSDVLITEGDNGNTQNALAKPSASVSTPGFVSTGPYKYNSMFRSMTSIYKGPYAFIGV